MRTFAVFVATALITVIAAHPQAQSDPDVSFSFEVASVKPNRSDSIEPEWKFQGGRFTARNVTLKALISTAYGAAEQPLADFQISGGPSWLASDRFDIVAKGASESAPSPNVLTRAALGMLRSLLEDRFQLKTHYETKDMPIFAMVRANVDGALGPGLRPSAPGTAVGGRVFPGNLSAKGLTMTEIVSGLARFMPGVSRIVVDRTGLSGSFDLDLTWTPDQAPQGAGGAAGDLSAAPRVDPTGPSLFTALREQLGLRLESTRGPVKTLIIDRVQKPTED